MYDSFIKAGDRAMMDQDYSLAMVFFDNARKSSNGVDQYNEAHNKWVEAKVLSNG